MKITIASDHAGLDLKSKVVKHLQEKNKFQVLDLGPFDEESVDYPDYAVLVTESIREKTADFGILICGTGIGMCMAANKVFGIRAALVSDVFSAEMTRKHNDANVLCLGARVIETELALKIVDIFFNTEFEGGRHQRRIDKMHAIENKEAL